MRVHLLNSKTWPGRRWIIWWVSSRLLRDDRGQLVAVITSPVPRLEVGATLFVLGNDLPVNEHGVRFLGARTGQLPSPELVAQRYPTSPRQPVPA